MDRASFEHIGNVGKLEIKPIKDAKKLAIISLATSERWKAESGDWIEKTYWHRVVVFAPAKVTLIEKAVKIGTRLRLVGQIRPSTWEGERGQKRHSIEFVVTGFGDVEILARGKPKADDQAATPPANTEKSRRRAVMRRTGRKCGRSSPAQSFHSQEKPMSSAKSATLKSPPPARFRTEPA